MSAIKADLRARIVAVQPSCDTESAEPILIGDTSSFEQELREEVQEAMKAGTLPRRQGSDAEEPRGSSANATPPSEDFPDLGSLDTATREDADGNQNQAADNP